MNLTTDRAARAPMLHLPADVLLAMHRALAQDRPPEEAAARIREIGFHSGEAFHAAFAAWLRERGEDGRPELLPAARFWQLLAEFFSSLGWGELRLETPRDGVASLASAEWAEAYAQDSARQPSCHLTTGILADLLGRIAGTDLAVMEVECRSRGDRQCRFLLGGPDALGLLHERLREGASYPEALEALA